MIKTMNKSIIKLHLAIFLLLFITYLLLPFSITAQQSPLSIQFSPTLVPIKTGEEKIIKFTLNSEDQISAFDLNFQTSGSLQVFRFENNIGFDTTVDPFTIKQVAHSLSKTNSRIAYIINSPQNNLPKKIDLYIKVKGTTTGQAKITLDYNNSQVLNGRGDLLKINPNQEATYSLNLNESSKEFINPSTLPPPNYPDNTALVDLKLKLFGAQNQPQNLKALAVAVGRVGETKYETEPHEFNLVPNSDGTFSGTAAFPNFKDGTKFSLMIKVDKYLLKRICNSDASESKPAGYTCTDPSLTIKRGLNNFDFSNVSLLPGDLGLTDGILNGYDLSLVRNNLSKNTPEAVALADLNYDNQVDEKDLNIIKFIAGSTGREADQ